MNRRSRVWMGLLAVGLLSLIAGKAHAYFVWDPFLNADHRGIGGYPVADLTPQNPAIPGFSGAWTDGTTATGQWSRATGGLASGFGGEYGGRASYGGFGAGIRRVYRNVSYSNPGGNPTYYFGGLLRLDGNADLSGLSVAGFVRNLGLNDTQFFDPVAAKDMEGLQWGFEGDGSQIDMVIRHRYNDGTIAQRTETLLPNVAVGDTHFVVMKLEMNVVVGDSRGNDRVSVWIDPGDVTNETAAGAPDLTFVDYALSSSGNIQQLVFASDNFGNPVSYDEMRFGRAWGDVAVRDERIARDRFDSYAAGTNVNSGTLNGGTGWGGVWVADAGTDKFSVENPGSGLSFVSDGVGDGGGFRALRIAGFGGGGSERSVSRPLDAAETGDVFASFLVRWDGDFQTGDFLAFHLLDGGSLVARMGIKANAGGSGGDFFVSLGLTASFPSGLEFDPNRDHLMVARLFKRMGSANYNAMAMWLDPDFADYASPDHIFVLNSGFASVDGIRFLQRDLESGEFVWVDQLRIGTSWQQVVVIPEPGMMALLALGGLGLLRRRRRRGARGQAPAVLAALVAVAVLLVAPGASHAALIAYDGFEAGGAAPGAGQYETGTGFVGSGAGVPGDAVHNGTNRPAADRAGQAPVLQGFNLANPWATSDGYASTVYYQASDFAMSYKDAPHLGLLDTLDGSVRHLHEATPDDKSVFRTLVGTPAPAGTVSWYSFLMRYESEDDAWSSTAELRVRQGTGQASERFTSVGINASGQLRAFESENGTSATGPALAEGTDHLIVVRLEELAGVPDSMHVWLDPLLGAEPVLATADAVIVDDYVYVGDNANFPMDTLILTARLNNTGAANPEDFVFFDEFRLGSTWADVTPFELIPEPGTMALLALGGLGLLRRRRRRGRARKRATGVLLACAAVALLVAAPGLAHAGLLAYDGFPDGGAAPGASEYETGTGFGNPGDALNDGNTNGNDGQSPALTGFSSSDAWTAPGGSPGTYASNIYFRAESSGLLAPGLITAPGQMRHFRSSGIPFLKRISRDATTTDVSQTQWASFLVRFDSDFASSGDTFQIELRWNIIEGGGPADRPLVVGVNGSQQPFFTSSGNDQIPDTGSALAADTTHLFVIKMVGDQSTDGDFTNGRLYDTIDLWIDPDILQGEANLTVSAAQHLAGQGIFRDHLFGVLDNTRAPFGNLEFESEMSNGSFLIFDEFRLGTTFKHVAPVPEPGTLTLLALGGLGLLRRRRRRRTKHERRAAMRNLVICGLVMLGLLFAAPAARAGLIYSEDFNGVLGSQPAGWAPFTSGAGIVSRNDGASAYEQRRTGTDTTTIASYAQPDDSDRGIWRDTTTTAILRFSGGAGNRNGLVVRSRGIASHTTGDFYHARIEGNTLRLFRVRNGAFSSIAFDSTGDAITGTPNRLMKVRVDNIPVPETDNVRLRVDLYKGATEASGLLRSIDYTDISTLAITRAGGVGFRSYITTNGVRSVFNTLRVSNNNRFLLWYDDYYDGDGLRDEAFVSGVSHAISNRKSEFTGISTGDRGMALLDWDAETSTAPWRDVKVRAIMRLITNNTGGTLGAGLVLRETGATNANDGDYYNYCLVRDEGAGSYSAELWRANSGSFALLDSVALTSAQVPESANIFLKFTSFGPLLTGMASLNADFSSPFGLVSALDSGAGAILTPGSVGYRVYGGAGITSGIVNFDNLTVTEVIPEPASLTLLAFGGVGLLARRRRRK